MDQDESISATSLAFEMILLKINFPFQRGQACWGEIWRLKYIGGRPTRAISAFFNL